MTSRCSGPTAVLGRENEVRADLAQLHGARVFVTQWLAKGWADRPDRHADVVLIFVELLTNAIVASPPNGTVRFSVRSTARGIAVRIVNQNTGLNPIEVQSMPEPDAVSGRGLALAQHYADLLEIHAAGAVVDISAHFHHR